jgi:hypothetical protein
MLETAKYDLAKSGNNQHGSVIFVHGLNSMDRNNHGHITLLAWDLARWLVWCSA